MSLNRGGGIQLAMYDCHVAANGCVLGGNRGLDIQNSRGTSPSCQIYQVMIANEPPDPSG